ILEDHEEHDGHALLEALACGVASVGTRSGITTELLGDGTGVLLDPGRPAELAEALGNLACNPSERARLAMLGRSKAEREFALDVVARRKIDAYKRRSRRDYGQA